MAEDINQKQELPDCPFWQPNQNQTRNYWQNYLDFHCCEKAMTAKGIDVSACEWNRCVYKCLCSISCVLAWDKCWAEGMFPGKIWTCCIPLSSFLHPSPRWRWDLGTSHPRILNHGLTNKYLLEKWKKRKEKKWTEWNLFCVYIVFSFNNELNVFTHLV